MRLFVAAVLAVCCIDTGFALSDPVMLFDPASNPRNTDANWDLITVEGRGAARCFNIVRDTDPYSKVRWEFSFDLPELAPGEKAFIEIVHLDLGAGIIEPAIRSGGAPWQGPERQRNYARLNSHRERSAYFQFPPLRPGTAELRIAGLQALRAIRLYTGGADDWSAFARNIPADLEPMVILERPVDLVTTAGISVFGNGPGPLERDLENVHELAPLAKVLGFNAIEMYVRWNALEFAGEGQFDFSYYDALVEAVGEYGLQWFPLLIVGSAYALPPWFVDGPENHGFVCLEHGVGNDIQSIWSPTHRRHVERVLKAFGDHYDRDGTLLGVRLGPSGNYGESQYPAGGNWPAPGREMHIHIGLWCGDAFARTDFQETLAAKYGAIAELNAAWGGGYRSFGDIAPQLPQTIQSKRQRLDQMTWYVDAMSDWCAWWAGVTAGALPNTKLYQSAGGWGFVEAGTDYTAQTQSMAALGGGIRLTNETDSYDQNFYATRLAATAARLYGVDLGYEPASSHTARGTVGRIYNTAATNGDHLFTYHSNVFNHPMAIDKWLEFLPLLDTRTDPVVDVAIYYPETANRLDDGAFRHLYAWGFNPRAAAIRREMDVDYLDERLIRDGFLERYKALVFVWGEVIDADVLERIDAWIRAGGMAIFPSFPRGAVGTPEGDTAIFSRWAGGDTGRGAFLRFPGDMDPPYRYARWVRDQLLESGAALHPWTRAALEMDWPEDVFWTIQNSGHLLALNYGEESVKISSTGSKKIALEPFSIRRIALPQTPHRRGSEP